MRRRGTQLTAGLYREGVPHSQIWKVDADDFGLAPTKIKCGDLDGSGEAPGVQLEFEHEGCPGGAAVAYSAREAELVGHALIQAASKIAPSDRLRQRHRKWRREIETTQPARIPPVEVIALGSTQEACDLLAVLSDLPDDDERKARLADVITQLEIPF